MPKIFISHSSKDDVFADKLANALRERGANVWIDHVDIPAGMKWSKAIQQGLDWGELMLLIVTPESMASDNVADEWEYYHQKKKPIIPVWWKPAEMPFQLHRLQYIDFHQRDFDAALVKLGVELSRLGFGLSTSPLNPLSQGRGDLLAAPPPLRSERGSRGEARQFPLIVKPDWVDTLIPEPFEWCYVPAGKVTLNPTGDKDDYLKQKQTFDVPDFMIARYPITNQQFNVFVDAIDGWRDPSWWDFSSEAEEWRSENVACEPPRFKAMADAPRETVTWYAAVAFTRWLSSRTGEQITLPTDQQWQRAAQGDDGRIYPWGDAWDADKCNSRERDIRQTTPVTRYPGGASPVGVFDMSGNVWEWCATSFAIGSTDLNRTDVRVVRGGSWLSYPELVRAVYRFNGPPNYKYGSFGFRVVCGAFPI